MTPEPTIPPPTPDDREIDRAIMARDYGIVTNPTHEEYSEAAATYIRLLNAALNDVLKLVRDQCEDDTDIRERLRPVLGKRKCVECGSEGQVDDPTHPNSDEHGIDCPGCKGAGSVDVVDGDSYGLEPLAGDDGLVARLVKELNDYRDAAEEVGDGCVRDAGDIGLSLRPTRGRHRAA